MLSDLRVHRARPGPPELIGLEQAGRTTKRFRPTDLKQISKRARPWHPIGWERTISPEVVESTFDFVT